MRANINSFFDVLMSEIRTMMCIYGIYDSFAQTYSEITPCYSGNTMYICTLITLPIYGKRTKCQYPLSAEQHSAL